MAFATEIFFTSELLNFFPSTGKKDLPIFDKIGVKKLAFLIF